MNWCQRALVVALLSIRIQYLIITGMPNSAQW